MLLTSDLGSRVGPTGYTWPYGYGRAAAGSAVLGHVRGEIPAGRGYALC